MGSDHNVAWVMGDLQYDKSYFTCASHMLIICQKHDEVLHSTTAVQIGSSLFCICKYESISIFILQKLLTYLQKIRPKRFNLKSQIYASFEKCSNCL